MAAINEIRVNLASANVPPEVIGAVKSAFAVAFWQWYRINKTDRLVTIKWWFIRKTIRVGDLHDVFEMLFGPETKYVSDT